MKCETCSIEMKSPWDKLSYKEKPICYACIPFKFEPIDEKEYDEAGNIPEVDGQKSLPSGDGGGLPNCS